MKKFKQKLMLLSSILFIFTGVRLLCLNAFAQVVVDDGAANIGQGGDEEGTAILLPGPEVNSILKSIAEPSYHFVRSLVPAEGKNTQIISTIDSENQIVAWYDKGTIYYYTTANLIYMNENSSNFFMNFDRLVDIDIDGWDTSKVKNMSHIFEKTRNLKSLDVSEWDTSNVEDMSHMFDEARDLESLDVSNWDTSKVEDMSYMFRGVSKVDVLDVSKWDTGKVKNTSYMFSQDNYSSDKIQFTLDLSGWNVSSVTDMNHMFYDFFENSEIETLDIGGWDVSNVKDMSYMFYNYWNLEYYSSSLKSLDLSGWNVKNLTNMSYMFYGNNHMKLLDVSNWKPNNKVQAENMFTHLRTQTLKIRNWNVAGNLKYMFSSAEISTIDLSNRDTSGVTDMEGMFQGAIIPNLDLSNNLNLSQVESFRYMFSSASINTLNLSGWNIETGSLYEMFTELKVSRIILDNWKIGRNVRVNNIFERFEIDDLNLESWDVSEVTNMYGMFNYTNIKSLNLSGRNTCNVTGMSFMFSDANIENLNVSNWDTRKVENMYYIFYDTSLKNLDLSTWDIGNVKNLEYAFYDNNDLITLDLSNWNTKSVEKMTYMFSYSNNLEKIYASTGFRTNHIQDIYVNGHFAEPFGGNNKLVGGNGTKYSEALNSKQYAVVDKPREKGLLTDKNHNYIGYRSFEQLIGTGIVNSGELIQPMMPSQRARGNFLGRYESGSSIPFNFDIPVTRNINLYQKWDCGVGYLDNGTDCIESVVISFNTNGGTEKESIEIPKGNNLIDIKYKTVHTPNLSDNGVINGYYNGANVQEVVSLPGVEKLKINLKYGTDDLKYYSIGGYYNYICVKGGKYEGSDQCNYSVSGRLSGGKTTPKNATFEIMGDSLTIKLNNNSNTNIYGFFAEISGYTDLIGKDPVMNGKIFGGWYKDEELQEKFEYDEDFAVNENITLYAKWENIRTAELLKGNVFRNRLLSLGSASNINQIIRSASEPIGISQTQIISTDDSENQIIAWYDNGIIYYYTNANLIFLNENSNSMFSNLSGLTIIDMKNWDTSNVIDMSYMFKGTSIVSLDLSTWDTSNVTDMSYMFSDARSLTTLDVSTWDTSKVENMSHMFHLDGSLTLLDVSNWNTSKVKDMNSMFYRDHYTQSSSHIFDLDVSNWDVTQVTDMGNMFMYMDVENLDLSKWNVSNVTNIGYMFSYAKIKELNVENWDTRNVTDNKNINGMFNTAEIEKLDAKNWKIATKDISRIFSSAKIKNIDVSNWNTENITGMECLFCGTEIDKLDLNSWDTRNVENMSSMFDYSTIGVLNLNGWDLSSITKNPWNEARINMFDECVFGKLDVGNWNIGDNSNITSLGGLFEKVEVEFLDLSTWDVSNITYMDDMFKDAQIETIDLSNWDTSNVTSMRYMFAGNNKLRTIYATNSFNVSKLGGHGGYNMFLDDVKIVGGNGTEFDPIRIHDWYAKVDRPGFKGYFTDRSNLYVNFFVNGEVYKTEVIVSGGKVLEPENPKRTNSIFEGWYLEEDGVRKYNFNLPLLDHLSLYAKWECKEGTEAQGNRCVAKPGQYKELEIVKPNTLSNYEGEESYIIMDRNLGAIGAGETCTRPDLEEVCGYAPICESTENGGNGYGGGSSEDESDSNGDDSCYSEEYSLCAESYENIYSHYCEEYGLYYQWGNYYGFLGDEEEISERVNTLGCEESSTPDYDDYGNGYGGGDDGDESNSTEQCNDIKYSWSNPYEESKFIYDSNYSDWSTETNDDLWGAIEDTEVSRQGPCPNGWHVPTQKEWNDALTYWDNREKVGDETDNMSFKEYLGLHGAGYRSPLSTLNNVGESWYWTTTPSGSQMYRLRIQGNSVGISSTSRMNALPVRCFKNQSLERQVSFDSNGGNSVSAQTVMVGEYATKPNDPVRAGYIFLGWYKDNGTFNNEFDFSTKIKSNITLYAKWEKLNKVTFETNGGSSISAIYLRSGKQILGDEIAGKKVSHTENIDDSGVSNGGYGNDQNLKDVVTIPGAEQLKIVLTYQSEDSYDGLCVKKGDYSYYTYEGCDDSDSGKLSNSSEQTEEFIIEGDTVTFVFGSDYSNDEYYGYYAEIIGYKKLKNPTKAGFSFEGWYKDSGLSEIWDFNNDTVNSDITLYAKWNKVPVYTFKTGEGTFSDGETENVVIFEKKSAKKSGYYTCENVNKFSVPYAEKINLELYDINSSSLKIIDKQGVIKEIVPEYDYYSYQVAQSVEVEGDYVEIIDEDGLCYTISLSGIGYYKDKEIEQPTRQGYSFEGWYREGANGEEIDFDVEKDFVKEDITLHAKWKKNLVYTYNANSGKFSDDTTEKTVEYGKEGIEKKVEGFGFGAGRMNVEMRIYGSNGIVVGVLNDECSNSISFGNSSQTRTVDGGSNGQGYNFQGDSIIVEKNGCNEAVVTIHGTGYEIENTTIENPTRAGYTFAGWYREIGDGKFVEFKVGKDFVDGDTTIYAKWDKNVKYKYDANGGKFSDNTDEKELEFEKKEVIKKLEGFGEDSAKIVITGAENLEVDGVNITCSEPLIIKTTNSTKTIPEYGFGYGNKFEGDSIIVENNGCEDTKVEVRGRVYEITTVEQPTRQGYSFEGWYREGANGEEIDFDVEKDLVKEDITLHAKWKKNLVYTYNANSGKFSDDTTEKAVEYGKKGIEKKVEGFGFGAGRMDVEMRIYGSNGIVADVSNDKCYNSISFGNSEQTKTVAQESYGYGFNFEGDSIIIEKNGCDSAKVTIYGLGYEIENTTIENPTREGYTFAGWYREISDGKFVEFKVGKDFVDEDTTIYAKWDKNVKYKYDANEGKFSDNTDEKEFEFEKKEVIKKLEGFGDDSAKIVITGAENLEVDGVNITCSEPLIIKTTNSTKTIPEYGFGYGNKFEGDSIIVENNGCEDTKVEVRGRVYEITTVEQPTRQGYTFDGWYREGANGEQIDFDIEKDFVAEDITLHAKWLKNIVYTYNANGGKYSDDTDEKYFEYPRENVTRETVGFGYGNGKDDVFMKIIGANGIDVDVSNDECSDKIKVYNSLDTLTVKPNSFGYGYGFDGDSIFVKKNGCDTAKVTLKGVGYDIGNEEVETPTKDGYEFVGWNTDPEANDKLDVLPNEALDTTFYAIFTKKIEVTFDINGNSGSTQKVSCNLYNDDEYCSITAPEIPEQKGWEVIGYDTDKDGHENNWSVGEKKVVSEDMTYYAQVKRLPIQKYVSFDINGNTSFKYGENPVVTTSGQYELCQTPVTYNGVVDNTCSAEIVFPTIVASGTKEVLGWSRSPENLSDIINVDTLMRLTLKGETTNVTYYAQTKKDKVTYSVIFNGNGALLRNNAESALQSQWTASCETEDSYNSEDETKSTECEIQLPEIIREGYTILGYSTGIDDLEASIKRAQEKLILTPENNWTIYYAISYKPLYTVFKTNGNLQIQSNTTITTEKDVTEPCSLRNANTTCTIKTPVIVGTKQGEVWYSSSDEKANRFDNRQNEDTEIIVSEDTPKTYYAWSVSNPETFTVSYLTGKGIESIGEIPAGADQCTPELTYNDEELKTTCTITNLPNVIQKVGYNTPLWYDQNDDSEGFTPNSSYNTEINRNITFVANATANTDTQYIVKHYFQMLEDNKITNKYELKYTDTKAGETDTNLILSNLQVDEDKSVGFKYRLGKVNGQFTSNEIPEDELEGLSEQNLDAYDGAKVLEIHLFYQRMKYAFALENNDPSKIDVTGSSSNNNYYYEQELDLSGSVTNDCYVRSGWDGIDTGLEIIETSGTKNIAKLKMPPRALTVSPEVKEKTYNVSFNKNAENVEGEMETLVAVKCSEGLTLPVNQFKKNGYSFLGWSRAAESEKEFDDNETLDTPLTKDNNKHETLYAQWHLDAYEINYALNDGIVLEPNPSIYTYENGDVLINNPIKTGYTFLGWSGTDINGSSYEVIIPSGSTGDRNYEANWEINHYSIYFNTEGGSEVETITQEYATPVTAPSDPTKEGYTFLGWNKEIPSTMPAEDTTITANWHINTYNFTLTGNGGIINGEDEIYSRGIVYNDEVEVPEVERLGYTFLGWNIELPERMPAEDTGAIAQWQANKYTVKFVNGDEEKIQEFEYDEEKALDENTFEKEGYTFAGWISGARTYNDKQVVKNLTANSGEVIELTAEWNPVPYTVTFYKNDGTNEKTVEHFVYDKQRAIQTSYERDGYFFKGWNTESDGNGEIKESPVLNWTNEGGTNINLYAQWELVPYTIVYTLDGGNPVEENPNNYGVESEFALKDPSRVGYDFLGWTGGVIDETYRNELNWTSEPSKEIVITYGSTGDRVYTAKWQARDDISYTVKHVLQALDGSYDDENGYPDYLEGTADSTVVPVVNKYSGFSDATTGEYTINPDGSTVIFYHYPRNSYKLTFKRDNGSDDTSATLKYGETIVYPENPTKVGYTFFSWSEIDDTMPAKDFEIWALYDINQYTLTLNTNGGSEIAPITQDFDTEITVPETTKIGYTFAGWEPKIPARMPAENISSSAQWNANPYKVIFHANNLTSTDIENGVEELLDVQDFVYDEPQKLQSNSFEKAGYHFLGWSNSSLSTEVIYANEQQVNNLTSQSDGTIDLYAVWEPDDDTVYKVKYLLQNIENDEYTALDNEEETLGGVTDTPTKAEAKTFEGFTLVPFEQKNINGDGSTVVEIKYTRDEYTITFNSNKGSAVNPMTLRYNSGVIAPENPNRLGYTFNGWTPSLPSNMPANNFEVTAEWLANTGTHFTVEYYVEYTTGGYSETPTQTVVKTGTTDTSTNFTAPEMEGFVVQPYENKNIEPDESTVLKIYYKRLIHKVTYDSRGGSEVATKEVRFGEKIERPAITKVGYRFDGWSGKEFMPNEDVTLTAEWTARSDIKYTVKHLQENANDEGYTENEADREELIGTTDTPTQAVSKDYPGFVAQQFSQENIKGDNTTVVEIKYNRLSYDITFNSNKGTKVNKITAKYDENLTAPEDPTRKGYTFDGWNPQFPSTMPLNGAELTAQWSANTGTAYVVHHYLANLDGSFPAKRDYEDESQGETDTPTKAAPKVVAGYTAQAFEQENIEGDGSTVVNIYYDRNIYTVSYDANGGTTPTEERMIFGDVIPNKETTRPGYDFVEWTGATTVPAGDVTVKAIWNERDDTLYTVKHYLQKVSLDGYTEVAADREELHGRTNSDTQAEAKTYDGFTAKTFSQKAIEGEGTTVVQIFYDRNEYTLSFDSNGGTPVASITAKYGTALTYPANPIRTGYAFTSWSPKFPSEMPLDGGLLTAQWSANNNTQYSIEYYYQKLDGTYPEEPSLKKTASGTTDTQTDKVAETISGYTVQDFDQVNIDPEGDAVLKLYYNRNAYTLNYYSEVLGVKQEGEQAEKELKRSVTLKYQEPIDTTPLAKSGYRFEGWKNLPANGLMPYNDLDLEAQWSVNENTEYKVYHLLQNVYDDNYSIEEVTEKTGTTDTLTNAETIPFVGFTAKAFDQQYINGDNSTIVEIRYDRNSYTIDFDGNQGTTPNAITERFGTDLTSPAIPVRTGYTFAGWSPSFPSVMPAENRTLTAGWTANTTTKYTVSHYLQNVEDDAYTEDIPNRENKIGTTDTLTDASARTYDGFTAQKIKQENISGDDSTNVKIYYKRNYYTISFDANSGSETDSITDKYGATIIAPNDPTRLGYTFKGWNPGLPATMPVGDSTVVAQWKANTDTKYTIEYYLQGIDGKYPQVASLTRIATGETDTETNVVAEDILGFKVHTIQQTNINSDESGIARVYYTREQYQVSYDTNGGTAIQERMVKFEDDIPTPETTREGYTFNSWANMPSNGKMPAESIELLAQWTPNTDTKYTVKHLWEKVDESGYEVHATEEKIGTTEELTEASAIDYDGFTAQEFKQQVINGDGSTIVEIKYDRNTYDITFDTNGGLAKSPVSAKYEETLETTEDPEKEGYTFEEWEPTYPKSMPLRGARLMAKWTPNTDTEYTIEYYLQDIDNADDEYPDEPSYSTIATGTTDTVADVVVPVIEGFTAQDVDPVVIRPDGSSVVKIYYKRNSHQVTYDVDGGTTIPSETVKYEDYIPTPATAKTGYTFLEWLNMPSDGMMPDSDVELLASWRANNNTKYTVVHLQENANNSNYSEVAKETLTGTTDTLTKAVAKSYPGFNVESFVQEYINGDESTIIEIRYKRNQYTISFDANSGSVTEPITDKYGATLTAPNDPTRQGYTFAGWNPGFPSTMPLDGKTLRAQWTANDNTQYTIEYYLQELNGEYPTNPSSTRSAIGTTDEETNVVAETIEGFKAQPISKVKIAGDGSSVVRVYYTRNSYTLSYNTDGGSSIHDVTLLYEEAIPLPETTRAGYTFSSWKYLPSNGKMPANNLEIIAQWTANNNTKYTVRHLLENTYDDEYSEDESARETKTGTTDAQTKAVAKSYPGFTALPISQTTISGDESTTVDVKYTRNVYVVDFNTRGGTTIDAITGKYQVALTEPSAPTKTGYVFNGWNFDFPETMPLDGKTLVAKWKASTGTQYTVYHYLADLNGTFGQEPADVDYLKGETEQLTQAKTKVYAGFEPRDIKQETILADGSTIVNVYYDRKEYTVTYDPDGGTPVESVSLKFESPIPNKTTSKPGYDFVEWAGATTVPADDVTVTAIWSTRNDTVYTVRHFLENANDSEYAERVADETIETGRTEGMTNAKAKNYKGFTAQSIEQKTIEGDGSTVVKVYYTRNSYTINFNSDGGTAVSPITAKYGATVTAPENPTKTGYEFNGWSPNMPTTMPENGATLTAQWNASTTTYTVEHKVQSLEDVNTYTLRESEVVEGITEGMTNAKAKDYSGFAADEISQVVINGDHSTIVPVYYTRQSYKLNYNVAGGEEIASVTLKYQENIPLPTPSKQGYEFVEWTNIPENNKMPANDVTLVAKWSPRTDTSYTVKHLTENLNDGGYTEVLSDRVVKLGTTEELTNATANTYAGFTVQPIKQKEIAGDSSTVVEVKYSRNSYTISFDSNGGTAVPSITERYQTTLTAPENPTRKGYLFGGWEPKFPQVMGSEDTTLVAKWNAGESSYIVNHYVKNLAGDGYTLKEQETLAGKTESQTQAKEKSYEGFSLEKEIVQKEIKSDDSTIVDIYYKRNVYHITWIAGTGVEAINESGDYAYGTTVKVQARTKVGYTFSGGVSEKEFAAVVPARNSNIIVSATPNTYTVRYHANGGEGKMDDQIFTYDMTGTLNENTYVNSGKVLVGWSSEKGALYPAGSKVINLTTKGVFDLYAEWQASYKVIYKDANAVLFEEEYASGDVIKPSRTPSKNGYRFDGWDGMPKDNLMGEEDIEVTAKWINDQPAKSSSGGGGGARVVTKDTSSVSTPVLVSEDSATSVKKEEKTSTVEEPVIQEEDDHTSAKDTGETVKNAESHPTVTEEVLTAYQWSYKNKVTTLAPVERAMPEGYVYRGHMAKMVVNYALNVLGWELPEETPEECSRSDDASDWESNEIKNYARMSCELGIMGIDMDNFEPTRYVTRAQFGTILSRLLWGDTYNQQWSSTNSYYERHLNELKEKGIITQIDNPEQRIELREWVWVMLRRSDEYIKSSNTYKLGRSNVKTSNVDGKVENKEETGTMSTIFDSLFKKVSSDSEK